MPPFFGEKRKRGFFCTTMELAELNDHTYARALADEDIGNNALSCMGGPVQEDVLD